MSNSFSCPMPFITTEDRGAVRVINYANAPFGTMTAAGAAEMFDAVLAAGEALSVRVIVITGGLPGIFIRQYEVQELSDAADAIERGLPRAPSPSGGIRPPGFHALTDLIAAVEKPVVAAINGLCMGEALSFRWHATCASRGMPSLLSASPRRVLASFPAAAAPSACPGSSGRPGRSR